MNKTIYYFNLNKFKVALIKNWKGKQFRKFKISKN